MGIDVMIGKDGFFDMVVGHTRESRDKLVATMPEVDKKMRMEGKSRLLLVEQNGLTIKYKRKTGMDYNVPEFTKDITPGHGVIMAVHADNLSYA